jgi:exportin-2 (importin alpha re-exporter)
MWVGSVPVEKYANVPPPLGAMRVIITARQSLTPGYQAILARLVAIIGETSKNPSNPRFNQYNFESISALIR